MSGIYIPGIKMPENCGSCPLFDGVYTHMEDDDMYFCNLGVSLNYWQYAGKEEKYCPLVSVPDHGRLIDADAVDTSYSDPEVIETLDDAPTIIPADKDGET